MTFRNIVLAVLFAIGTFTARAQDNTAQYQYAEVNGPYGVNRTLKIATLRASAADSADHLRLTATANTNDNSTNNSYIDISFANRAGFSYFYTVHGAPITGCSHIAAYANSDGTTDIYFILPGNLGCWNVASYSILENFEDTVYATPTDLGNATPPGTLIFDSADPVHYPPQESLNFAGDLSPSGAIGVGTSSPTDDLDVELGQSTAVDNGITIRGSSSSYGDIGLKISNTGSGGLRWYLDSTNDNSGYGGGKLAFVNSPGASPKMVIDIHGNVGIGTTSPGATLDVNGTVRAGQFLFGDGSSLSSAASPSFSGDVGVGTSSPLGPLEIHATAPNPYGDLIVNRDNPDGTGGEVTIRNSAGGVGASGVLAFELDGSTAFNADGSNASNAEIRAINNGPNSGAGSNASDLVLSNWNGASEKANLFVQGATGNVGVGTTTPAAKLEIAGNVKISGTGASITFPDGTVQSTAYTGSTCSTGGDYAESVDVAGDRASYEPGDVMVLAPQDGADVVMSSVPYSTTVAGIYSTKPGYVGRRQLSDPKTATQEIPMAMVGIVPTKVSAENGPIHRGDLLVTSSIPGYAMKGTDHSRMTGAIVGKAMGTLEDGTGVIEVLVSLQ